MTFSLSSSGLANVASLPVREEDIFTFKVSGMDFECGKYVAVFISPLVAKMIKQDPLFTSLTIENTCKNPQMINVFINKLLSGQKFEISKQFAPHVKEIGVALQNPELISFADQVLLANSSLSTKNIINIIKSKLEFGQNITDEISYVAKNISFVSRTELSLLDIDILDQILSCPDLLIENEDWLVELIFDICQQNPNPNSTILFRNVSFEYVSTSGITRFLKLVNPSNITGPVWSAICERLRHDVVPTTLAADRYFSTTNSKNNEVDEKIKTFEFTGNPFEGILSSMNKEAGQNPHSANLVEVTSSSKERSQPWMILDYKWNGWFYTRNQPDSWVMIDFINKNVAPSWYSIKSDGNGSSHLKNWNLEGSNDLTSWSTIDEQRNSEILNNPFAIGTFKCLKPRYYRYIRLRQVDVNTDGNNYLGLCNIELFGSVKEIVQ